MSATCICGAGYGFNLSCPEHRPPDMSAPAPLTLNDLLLAAKELENYAYGIGGTLEGRDETLALVARLRASRLTHIERGR